MSKLWRYEVERDHDGDRWIYEHRAVNRETGNVVELDVSSCRPSLPVEEWMLHVELAFPRRSEVPGGTVSPLELRDLLAIRRSRERENND